MNSRPIYLTLRDCVFRRGYKYTKAQDSTKTLSLMLRHIKFKQTETGFRSTQISPWTVRRPQSVKTESIKKLTNLIFSGEKPCTRIIQNILHSFIHFSRAKDVISHPKLNERKFLMGAGEHECQISQNYILHMKFSEFYLRFHNSCEIWHSFSQTPMRNFLWCYYRRLITSWLASNQLYFKTVCEVV